MKKIATEIHIDAPPEKVWKVLVDFTRMEWNPMFASISGTLAVGERLAVVVRKPKFTLRPRVTGVENNHSLAWKGSLLVPGLADGQHRFELIADGKGTRFSHGETFTGLLVPLLGGTIAATEKSFVRFNQALKSEAERLA